MPAYVLRKDLGVARMTVRYDERGNRLEDAYFGADAKPTLSKQGFARVTYRFDERGNQIEWADFGTDGKPVPNSNGVARSTIGYDDRGNKVEEAYFGADGKPTLGKVGFARVTYLYDKRGNQIEWADFDTDGNPIANNYGIARTTFRYDERGNKMEQAAFGADGNPVLDNSGVARVTTSYDERGNKSEEAYFGTDGKPIISKQAFWVQVRYSYNSENEVNGVTYLDEQGRAIAVEAEIRGVVPGSVAERIGLASGDRVLTYDSETIKSAQQLTAIVTHSEPGVHKLTVRHGATITIREVPAGRLGVNIVDVRAETKPAEAARPSAH